MKIFLILICILGFRAQATEVLQLSEVTKMVSEKNFTVLIEAEKLYQAKLNIENARRNLLPHLNLWSLAKIPFDPMSIIEMIPEIAPFLVPANWFRLSETQILYLAEKEGYRALWANELSTARNIYFHLLMDKALLSFIQSQYKDLTELYSIAQSRYAMGFEKIETLRTIEIQKLKIGDDLTQMSILLNEELSNLSLALGLPVSKPIDIAFLDLAPPNTFKPVDYRIYLNRAVDASPEIRQFEHILKVVPFLKKEAYFSFLGVSETSRGVAGGVFDEIPFSNGLGFSTATTVKIINSQSWILEKQKEGIRETIEHEVYKIINLCNTTMTSYTNNEKAEDLATANVNSLKQKLLMGEKVDLLVLAESFEAKSIAQSRKLEVFYRFWMNADRLLRLILDDEYKKSPAIIEGIRL